MRSTLIVKCAVLILFGSVRCLTANDDLQGIVPTGGDGAPLNLNFETGTLQDWVVEGEAFRQQPIQGDTVSRRRADSVSNHEGDYWIGGFEVAQDRPVGKLTSVPFEVRHPWASMLVGGGQSLATRVEIVRDDSQEVIVQAVGQDQENMARVAIDLSKHVGKPIFIRLIDDSKGRWGHLNFDDFRFHSTRPNLPQLTPPPRQDQYEHAGLSPEQAAKAMTLPEGFTVSLFAGEPDVQQPIAMAFDDRGRLWVAEAYSYPVRLPEDQARDRILIFEDTDGDGRFNHRKVFADKLNLVSGLELGFGGVWVGAAPHLLFIPDRNEDDIPDGPPQVMLDGWGYQDTHETLNTFKWGPDGWLYGCHGVFTHSRVGMPGTPDEQRVPINAGVWRYHPTQHKFEVFAEGTSNPWGIDFNSRGQAFITACVIPHLYHVILGGRYQRQSGQHFNPYTYDDIKTIAVHRHYVGANPHGGNGRSDEAGGGHAHAGAMIYLGGAWPENYHDQIFMNNIHGARLNQDALSAQGSGYVGNRAPDFCLANDRWSQILNLAFGPDGQVYMIDWYDANQCHHGKVHVHDRSNGRIFKISYGNANGSRVDLKSLSSPELVKLLTHKNDWYARHARRILQERNLDPAVVPQLESLAFEHPEEPLRLRGLWGLAASGALNESRLLTALNNNMPYVRAWAVQFAAEGGAPSKKLLARMRELAKSDPSPVVRLYLASAAARIGSSDRVDLLTALATRAVDADDHNIPLMIWYAVEPLVQANPEGAFAVLANAEIPLVRGHLVRRLVHANDPGLLERTLELTLDTGRGADDDNMVLAEIERGFEGRRQVAKPDNWTAISQRLAASANEEVRQRALRLSIIFGDANTFQLYRQQLADARLPAGTRIAALNALVKAGAPNLSDALLPLVGDANLAGPAIRALAAFEDARTPVVLLNTYANAGAETKRDILNTLASRGAYAQELLAAVERGKIPRTDLTADVVRQLRNLNDEKLTARITSVWGAINETPAEKSREIERLTKLLTSPAAPGHEADPALGRAVFVKTCSQCHTLFGVGGKVGPELTGSNRADLNYLLSNLIDPSALIGKDYQAQLIVTADGRVLTGIVKAEDDQALTLATANETIVLPKDEIEDRTVSPKSMMPDAILNPLTERELRSLVGYLASPAQTPLLATADTAKLLFNGVDLSYWQGNPQLWSVENGEIVGRSQGLKRNEFLRSDLVFTNFKLSLEVKLENNQGNSGIQFRSKTRGNGDVEGYQADIGPDWWGKLYEEHGRKILWKRSGEQFVKPNDWNHYQIEAVGSRIRTWINGQLCVDLDDPAGAQRGILAFQLHSGGPTVVRFRNLKIDVLPTQ